MSLKIVSTEIAVLSNINLKYLSSKTDKYDSEICYYAIETVDFDQIVKKDITDDLKMPYWVTPENKYILKVKSKYLEQEQKTKGVATLTLKKYKYESFVGYYVTKISFD